MASNTEVSAYDQQNISKTSVKRYADGRPVFKPYLLGCLTKQEPNVKVGKNNNDCQCQSEEEQITNESVSNYQQGTNGTIKEEPQLDDYTEPAPNIDRPAKNVSNGKLEVSGDEASPQLMYCQRQRYLSNLRSTFPVKLWELVEQDKTPLVTWSSCGRAIIIDTRVFDEKIRDFFTGEFGDNKLRNFCRQLRVYDFNEVTNKDPNWPTFSWMLVMAPYLKVHYHYFFRKGHPENLAKIVRVRDLIPRGRSKPKHPRLLETLLTPTGPYFLDQPPLSLLDQSTRKAMRDLTKQELPESSTEKTNSFSSALEKIGHEAIVSSSPLDVQSKTCSRAGRLAMFCGSLKLNPVKQSQNDLVTSNEVPERTIGPTENGTENAKITEVKGRDCDTSISINSQASVRNSYQVTFSKFARDPRLHKTKQGQNTPHASGDVPLKLPEAVNLEQPHISPQKQMPASPNQTQQPSSLVLVPCLRMRNILTPLTYGSRLSDAGVDFLRQCPDFQRFLEHVASTRPTTDRGQQCSPATSADDFSRSIKYNDNKENGSRVTPTDHHYAKAGPNHENTPHSDSAQIKSDVVANSKSSPDPVTEPPTDIPEIGITGGEPVLDRTANSDDNLKIATDSDSDNDVYPQSDSEEEEEEEGVSSLHSTSRVYDSSSSDHSLNIDWSWDTDVTPEPINIQPMKEEENEDAMSEVSPMDL